MKTHKGASRNSARADSERFFTDAKFGKSRNTGCISDFSNCGSGEKDPLFRRRRVFRGDHKKKLRRAVPAYPNAATREYYTQRLLNVATAIASGMGLLASIVFLTRFI